MAVIEVGGEVALWDDLEKERLLPMDNERRRSGKLVDAEQDVIVRAVRLTKPAVTVTFIWSRYGAQGWTATAEDQEYRNVAAQIGPFETKQAAEDAIVIVLRMKGYNL